MPTLEKANSAKLEKILNEAFRLNGVITSWKQMINENLFVSKKISTRTCSERKTNSEYKEFIKPKVDYNLCLKDETFLQVQKCVFDSLVLPIN